MTEPLQFSLRSLMLFILAVAILAALLTMPYARASAILLAVSLAVPPALIVAFRRGGRDMRAFCAGAFLPALILATCSVGTVCYGVLTSKSGSLPAIFDGLTQRLWIRDQCLIVLAAVVLSGAISLLIHQASLQALARSSQRKDRPARPSMLRLIVQLTGRRAAESQREPGRTRSVSAGRRRHGYELVGRWRGLGEVLVRAEYRCKENEQFDEGGILNAH